jgi:hypothetical protein
MIGRIILLAILALSTACSQKQEPAKHGQPVASSKPAPANMTQLLWTVPKGWVEEPPSSGMRLSQYKLPKTDGDAEDALCYVSHFPGSGGSVEANLSRWYEQFIQPDGRPSSAVAKVNKAEHNGFQQTTVDVSGTFSQTTTPMGPTGGDMPNYRMLGGVIETPVGPWFVKLIGPEKTVAHWEKSFYEFMKSFRADQSS